MGTGSTNFSAVSGSRNFKTVSEKAIKEIDQTVPRAAIFKPIEKQSSCPNNWSTAGKETIIINLKSEFMHMTNYKVPNKMLCS
jgi:hypothetical protein